MDQHTFKEGRWLVALSGRRAAWLTILGSGGATIGVSLGAILAPGSVELAAMLFVAGVAAVYSLGAYRLALRPSIVAASDRLLIVNPIKTYTARWTQIMKVEPGYHGLSVSLEDGSTIIAWAVQKSNWAQWRKKHTRADEVAHELALRAAVARNSPNEAFELSSVERAETAKAVGRQMLLATAILVIVAIARILLDR